ncbi:unnamed protein product [Adineta steineri]|uniref:Rho-GAP domain-containing protein n=1 Tax=Adineta steineri TaxID=433720 RepID=A0A813MWA9_9BILA|nr:unnamed protein product [Adineta steineri]CAF0795175.1 unnamed protein product [Adineta steineri]
MARHTPLPSFLLDTDCITEHTITDLQTASTTPNIPQLYQQQQQSPLQSQRFQVRFRRSACSNLQSTTIHEGRIYNENNRRASLFFDQSSQQRVDIKKLTTFDEEPDESDYIRLCRQRCQSLYGSLPHSTTVSAPISSIILTEHTCIISDNDDDNEDDEQDEDEDERCFETLGKNDFRHSLPDTSPAGLAIRNFLKRNKSSSNNNNNNNNIRHHRRLGLPSNSSQSLCSSRSSSSSLLTSSPSPLSTFRNFLSLVKLPSSSSSSSTTTTTTAASGTTTKSIISTTTSSSSTSITPHHSSLTTLTSATGGSSTTLDQTISTSNTSKKRSTTSIDAQFQWHFDADKSQWSSSDGTSTITLGPIELHNLTYAEHKQLKRLILQRLQSSQYDLGVPIHVPKEEPVRKRKHHFMFRSKSSDKSKEAREAKSNGNVFGVALSQCVIDDDFHFQDDTNATSPSSIPTASGNNRKDSTDMVVITTSDRRTSPSGSVSSTNDSGYSVSPASPSSLHISDCDYEQTKIRSLSLEALAGNESGAGVNRVNTLRCYPAKVPELLSNCCDYLEKNALQTVGLFRVGVSKKRLKELKEQVNLNRSVTFDSTTNAHDIAGLIKEFLRELPEPLLTRDLCVPFLNIPSRLNPKEQLRALSYLIDLLPSSNRDTLYTLLKFLHHVSLNSQDRYATDGKTLLAGNKMDTANLAIVFAPTILMDGKAPVMTSKDMSVATSADQMEQGKTVLKMMIEQYKELFMISKDLHNQINLALNDSDNVQLMRALAFKVQNGCGINSMQLDETNEHLLMSLDLTPVLCETPNATTSIFSSIIPQTNRSNQQQQQQQGGGPILRRYNHRRNSDFPCSSTHSSRSSEFLQVPMSSSQQRISNHNHQTASKLPRVRDIREASMDQIIFRVIEPFSSVINEQQQQLRNSTEPVINISSFDDITTSSIIRPNTLDIKESPPSPPSSPVLRPATITTTSDTTLLREIKPYSRSKTAPLSTSSGAQNFLSVKRREARDLCGSSSNDDSPSPTSGHHSTLV